MNWSVWHLWSLQFFSSAWFSAGTRKLACQTLLWLTLLVVLPCSRAARVDVYASTIYTGTQAVGAVTCADFDPVHPGKELACFLADGSILELALGPTGWTATNIFSYHGGSPLWRDPTMRVSLKVGKVLPNVPGQQLVLSYFQQVFAVYYTIETGWTNQIISDQSANLGTSWDADVGPCDPTQTGDQVFSLFEAVYDFSSGTIYGNRDGVWKENFVYYAEVGMGVAIGNTNPDHSGNEIVVTTEMGPTYEILPPPTGGPGPWPMRTLWDDFENAGWVVKIGDVDPDTAGNEVIYGSRYSDSIMLSRYNGTNQHDLEILFTGVNTNTVANNIFDIAIGQIVPKSPGKQIVGVDESGSNCTWCRKLPTSGRDRFSGRISRPCMLCSRLTCCRPRVMKSWLLERPAPSHCSPTRLPR